MSIKIDTLVKTFKLGIRNRFWDKWLVWQWYFKWDGRSSSKK